MSLLAIRIRQQLNRSSRFKYRQISSPRASQISRFSSTSIQNMALTNGHDTANGNPATMRFRPTAAFDLRSDTLTTPNKAMLDAIYNATYYDDGYAEDLSTNDLEQHLATITGHEAGLLVVSGTMGNQIAVRTHLSTPPHSIICDARSHIANYEAGGAATNSGAFPIIVHPSNGLHLTLEDVKKHTVLSDNVHYCPTQLICLENTLNGMIMPLEEIKRIVEYAREHGIKTHLDGARAWEVVVAGGAKSLEEICSLFDSVSLCFSKGLGAPMGSMLVGRRQYIAQARRIRKMFGGGGRQSGIISAAARVALEQGFGEGGHLKACQQKAKQVAKSWTSKGGKLKYPADTNMVWLDIHEAGLTEEEFGEIGKKHGITINGGRLVIHYQLETEALQAVEKVFEDVFASKKQ